MRWIKFGIIGFFFFFAILTALSLLIPSHIRISKVVSLNHAPDSLFQLINDVSQWPRWHPALQGPQGAAWLQKNKAQLVRVSSTDSLVVFNWQQPGKQAVVNGWQLHRFSTADSVALQWYMDFNLKWYPWQKFGSLLYEGTYGRMMEEGLQNIKTLAQKQ